MVTLFGSFGNWVSRSIPSLQDPPSPAVPAKVRFVNQVLENPPDGKPFVVKIFGDPKQVANDVKFCVEAFPEVEELGVPSFDNSQVELNNVMRVERERVALTADCFKVGRLDKNQTLTIRYPAKIKQSPARPFATLKLRNSGDGYSLDEFLGPRSNLDRKDREPTAIASGSTVAHTTAANAAALVIGSGANANIDGGIGVASSRFNGSASCTTKAMKSAAPTIGSGNSGCSISLDGVDMAPPTLITAEEFDRLPKPRSFQQLALTSTTVNSGEVEGGFQVNGASGAENEFTIDGVSTTSLISSGSGNDQVSCEFAAKSSGADCVSSGIARYAYDQAGNLKAIRDANGEITIFTYSVYNLRNNTLGSVWIRSTSGSGNDQVSYEFAAKSSGADCVSSGITRYAYDQAGNLKAIRNANGEITIFTCDALGFGKKRAVPEGMLETASYTYESGNRLSQSAMEPGLAVTCDYDRLGGRVDRTTQCAYEEIQRSTQVFFAVDFSVGVPSEVTALFAERVEPDAPLYDRWFNPSLSGWIARDDERSRIVRPLRVRILDSGGADLTVTSEVDAEYQQRYQEERIDVAPRPLRVRMLNSGGADLTVTSEVDPTAVRMLDSGEAPVESRVVNNRRPVCVGRPAGRHIQRSTIL